MTESVSRTLMLVMLESADYKTKFYSLLRYAQSGILLPLVCFAVLLCCHACGTLEIAVEGSGFGEAEQVCGFL